jgi:DNA-directed RNA polymerase specialized sigma24 family protein
MNEPFTDSELHTATVAARAVVRVNRGYVNEHDVLQEIYVWMLTNAAKIVEWREAGTRQLYRAATRAGFRYVTKERLARTGSQPEDLQYYTTVIVSDLLADVFDYSSWGSSRVLDNVRRAPSRAAESGNRMAMLCDVSTALGVLPKEDRAVLQARFEGGLPWDCVARMFDMEEDTVRKRVDRILTRMVDRLGGPPPWYNGNGRRPVSNVQAQHATV